MAEMSQERLDELGERIDSVRGRAEDDGLLPEDDDDERDPTFIEPAPGEPDVRPVDVGDNQIAPPG